MVMRITNQIQQSNALQNIFRITEELFAANQRVATGKRINKASDDPVGIQDTLTLRSSIARIQQFGRNIDNNRLFLNTADTALDSVGLGITRALELAQGHKTTAARMLGIDPSTLYRKIRRLGISPAMLAAKE